MLTGLLVTMPALGAIGFGASGPIAGSVAAILQAGMGDVIAGSFFAILQSAAMGGYGVPIVYGAVAAGSGIVGGMISSKLIKLAHLFRDGPGNILLLEEDKKAAKRD